MALDDLNHNLAFNNFVERVIGETIQYTCSNQLQSYLYLSTLVKMSDN